MKANPLVIALGVLVLVGGFAVYTVYNPPEEDDDRITLIDAEADDVRQVIVHKAEGEPITVVRGEDGEWQFGGDIDLEADSSEVGVMVGNLAGLSADRVVEEEVTNWAPYGLEGDGEIKVNAELEDGSNTLIFGRQTPTGSSVYLRVADDPRLFTAPAYTKNAFDKTVFDWRDKTLVAVDPDTVSRMRLNIQATEFQFRKSDEGKWQVLDPDPLRADSFAVGDLLRAVSEAEMTEVVAEDASEGSYGFERAFAIAEVFDGEGSHTLTIAKQEDGSYLAKSSDLPGVYEISATAAERFDKDLEDFRNKKLFDFSFEPLSRLEVEAGETRAVVEKSGDQWTLASEEGRELDSQKVQALIDSLRNLQAIAFPRGSQARFGLDEPAIRATATLAQEGAQPETVFVSDPEKAQAYAMRQGEPAIYEIGRSQAEAVVEALEELLAPAEAGEAAEETEEQQ